jgi:Spy/CpxP family protein refolding chaperone
MKRLILLSSALLLLFAGSAFSQPPPAPEPDIGPPPGSPQEREQVRKKVRTLKMWKIAEELDLTDNQTDKFFPLFRNFETEVEKIRDENDELIQKLGGLIAADEDGKKIEEAVAKIEQNDSKILQLRSKFRQDASKILTPVQIGKLAIFQHEFPRRFRDVMREYGPKGGPPEERPGRPQCPLEFQGTSDNLCPQPGFAFKGHRFHRGQRDCICKGELGMNPDDGGCSN